MLYKQKTNCQGFPFILEISFSLDQKVLLQIQANRKEYI